MRGWGILLLVALLAFPAKAAEDASNRDRAKALIGCAEIARNADLETASPLEQDGFVLAQRHFDSMSIEDGLEIVPANLSRDQLSAFEMGRAYSEWIAETRRNLQALQIMPVPIGGKTDLRAFMDWSRERTSVAQDEYARRNCALLLAAGN